MLHCNGYTTFPTELWAPRWQRLTSVSLFKKYWFFFFLSWLCRSLAVTCGIFRFIYLLVYLFIFGCAGSSLLHKFFSSCREWGLHSSCGGWASYCGLRCLLLLQNRSSRVCSSQPLEYRLSRCGGWAQLLRRTWDLCRKNTGVGCYFLLQRIFPTQGWNMCLLHWDFITEPPGKPLCVFFGDGLDSGGKKSTKLA